MVRPLAAVLCMLALSGYAEGVARANGRFPRAQQIVSAPGDPSRLYLRATFGVVGSADSGASWRWLCEQAIGFSGTWDPPIAVTRDGRLFMGLEHGLAWTRDLCDVRTVPGVAGELVSDVSADGDGLIFVTSTPKKRAAVYRIARGVDARRMGPGLDGYYFDTIDAAGPRVYVTGILVGTRPEPHLFRSDDGGKTLRELRPAWPTHGRLYLAALDPKDADRLLVRQLGTLGSDLLLSEDGGVTFRVVLHMAGAMFGFAESPDGADVFAGSGDAAEGLYRSTDRGRTFSPVAKAPILCLHATAHALYACSNPFTAHGYAIGVSRDDGATLAPLLEFSDIRGPVACDAGAGTSCPASWTTMHATLTTQTASPAAPSALASATSRPATRRPARAGCGCETAPRSSSRAWLALAAVLAALGVRRSGA